jgi:hypothetical protein
VPRITDPQRSEKLSSRPARRRLAIGVAALALAPIGVLAGCGNAGALQHSDTRPEPNASTEGVRSVYPTVPVLPSEGPTVAPRSGPASPAEAPAPSGG